MNIPDKDKKFPLGNYNRLCFLKNVVKNPNIIVGDYIYYDDFESDSIVGGNPAKEIRKRYSEEQIETLLQISWWDWPIENITKHVQHLTGNSMGVLQSEI